MSVEKREAWASGEAYEPYIGRWSRLVARHFVSWLDAPRGTRWVDVGCGTGALTQVILELAAPNGVLSVDPSRAYLGFARAHSRDRRAVFVAADARRLPMPAECADVAVSGLALNFIPEPHLAIAEMTRVVHGGGRVSAYLWDYAGRMEIIRHFWDAAALLDPEAADLDEARRFPLCHPEALETLARDAGLREVTSTAIDVPTRFTDFDDFWTPFLGGQGPAPGYAMGLDPDHRASLRERLRATLPTAADGSIDLIARAWAVRGTRA